VANIKSLDQSGQKWVERAGVAGAAYTAGVQNPRTPWAAASAAGDANYRAGVTAAASSGAYARGIRAAGDTKWRENSIAKGPSRFAEGVSLARDAWAKGFGPYQSAIASLTLPARGPTGSPANLQRVAAVATALRALKGRAAA
jgi:hypothetical protein